MSPSEAHTSGQDEGPHSNTPQTSIENLLNHFRQVIATQDTLTKSSSGHPVCPLPQHTIPELPVTSSKLPEDQESLTALTSYLSRHVLPNLNQPSLSPNFYGFVTGGVTPAALLADWLTSLYDQNVQVHLPRETIATAVEVAALNQLVDLFRLPRKIWGIGSSNCGGGGTFTTGATASNILGLGLGREWVIQQHGIRAGKAGSSTSAGELGLIEAMHQANLRSLKVLSTLPHSSIAKAASVVGIGRSQVISVAKDGTDLDIDLAAIERHANESHTACILVISAGEVNTGRFATLAQTNDSTNAEPQWRKLRALCDRYNIWIHVDGAFGLFARMLLPSASDDENDNPAASAPLNSQSTANVPADEDYHPLLHGVHGLPHLADSITGDAHKLLNVPYDCGFFFTRHKHLSEQVFVNGGAAYLTGGGGGGTAPTQANDGPGSSDDFHIGDAIQSPLNIGLENSRRFRALPVHATLMAYGRAGHVDMLKRQIALARRIVRWLWRQPGFVVLPDGERRERAELGNGKEGDRAAEDEAVRKTFMIVLFRATEEEANEELVQRINADGRIYVTGTKWRGTKAARIAVSNWMVDVNRDGGLIEEVLRGVLGEKLAGKVVGEV